jgi:hypothetical protein
MRLDRFGGILLVTGAIVGVIAVVGLAVGFEPSQLPPKLLDIAAYKLTFGAAAVLLAVGAMVRRHVRAAEHEQNAPQPAPSRGASASPGELPPAPIDRDFANGGGARSASDISEAKARRER